MEYNMFIGNLAKLAKASKERNFNVNQKVRILYFWAALINYKFD